MSFSELNRTYLVLILILISPLMMISYQNINVEAQKYSHSYEDRTEIYVVYCNIA